MTAAAHLNAVKELAKITLLLDHVRSTAERLAADTLDFAKAGPSSAYLTELADDLADLAHWADSAAGDPDHEAHYRKPPTADRTFTLDDTPCPRCGRLTLVGWTYRNEHGEHMHAHFACTSWPSGGALCGWHGWNALPR